jgi:uncharacterized protein (TIGR02246 family)
MHKSAMFCSIILLAAVLGGCCTECDKPGVDKAAEAQAIRDLSAQWLTWSQEQNVSDLVGIFDAEAETIFDGEHLEGLAAIQANWEKEFAERPAGSTLTWTTAHVHVSDSGDLAYERGSWGADKDGEGEEPERTGQYLTIWKKVDGVWKVAADAGTTIKPPEEAAE